MRGKLWLIGSLIAVWLFVTVAGVPRAQAAPAAQAGPQTWTVLVGGQSMPEGTGAMAAGAWQYMRFYPANITVNVGDTIVWKINSAEGHQVIFPSPSQPFVSYITPEMGPNGQPSVVVNPLAALPQGGTTYDGSTLTGSGDMGMAAPGVAEYRLTFTKAGTFGYFCAIHSAQLPSGQVVGMTGGVTVQAAGSAYPKTQAQVDSEVKAALAADDAAAMTAEMTAKQVAAPTKNADGTMTYHGNIGWDEGVMSYMRFAPADFTVHAGDSIEWTQTSATTPHTVSLVGNDAPEVALVEPQAAGPPKISINPVVLAPAGGVSYSGSGYFNSGFMPGTEDPTPGPRTYKLTFIAPGTYTYLCQLHAGMGMIGTVTVLGGTAPGMPTTGHTDASGLLLALAGLALLLGGVTLRRRLALR